MKNNSPSIYLGREFRFERGSVYLIRLITRVLTFPLSLFPESKLKCFVRKLALRFQNSLPIELAVSKGEIAVQIGTPRPRTVRRFSRAVGSSGRVFVFEAEPVNFQRLQDAVQQEGLKNVTLILGAAWSSSGEGELSLSPYSGDHKVHLGNIKLDNDLRPGNQQMGTIKCPFYSIDDVLEKHDVTSIHYLSVTVNGAELEVLKGAERTLLNSPVARVYAKGHALQSDGQPLRVSIQAWLESIGFMAMKTKGEPSSTTQGGWQWRSGDVFAWKQLSQLSSEEIDTAPWIPLKEQALSSSKIEYAFIALLVLLIAVLPLQFIRITQIAGFKLNAFHSIALVLIVLTAYSFRSRLFRNIHQFEIAIFTFIVSCTFITFRSPEIDILKNLLTFVVKPTFYIVLLRSLIVVMSSLQPERFCQALRYGVVTGMFIFIGLFITALGLEKLGAQSGDLCNPLSYNANGQLVQRNDSEMVSSETLEAVDKVTLGANWAYNRIFISALQEFDLLPMALPISCARDIGPNAIAGGFLLYFCILLLFPSKKKRGNDWIMISICALLLVLTNSRGGIGLMISGLVWYWISKQPKLTPVRQTLFIPGIWLLFALLAASVMALLGLFDVYLLKAAMHSSRLAQYYEAIQLIQVSPLWGMGLGYKLIDTYGSIYVHNFLLSSGVMMGMLGLISAGVIFGSLLFNMLHTMTQPLTRLINTQQASAAVAILLFSPLLTLLTRSSIESIFLLSDWVSIAIFLVTVGKNNRSTSSNDPLSYEATTQRVTHS